MRLSNKSRSQKPSRRLHDSSRDTFSQRHCRFETLESRELLALSVTTADYRALAADSSLDGSESSALWVSSLEDVTNVNDGKITLREALDYAGQKLSSGEQVASTIRFKIGGTITLSSANQSLKVLAKNVTIDASDVGSITIQGQNSLLLYVFGGSAVSPVSVSLKNMTFTGGKTSSANAKGAGVQLSQNCNLTATNCSFTNNTSTDGSGVGIYVGAGSLTLINSVVSNNASQAENSKGGAVYVESGSMTASGTTFANNVSANGGAIYIKSGSASFNNCFFNNNRAISGDGGAIISTASSLTITNASFLKNTSADVGGALYVDGEKSAELSDIKFISNTSVNGGAIYHDGQALTIKRASFSKNQASQNGGAVHISQNAGFKINDASFYANKATLNGGAVYNGGALYLRGGVFDSNEAQKSGGALYSSYYFEIRDALFSQNEASDNGGAVYNSSASITSWMLRSAIKDSKADEGAAVYNQGRINVSDSSFSNNTANFYGGGISNLGDAYIAQSTFQNNKALGLNGAGGALLNYLNATLSLVNSALHSNTVPDGSGGGLANNGTVRIDASVIDNNTVGELGGGVYNGGAMTVQYSTISNNSANNGGGAANAYGSSANVIGSTLWGNEAKTNGGALYCYGPSTFQNCVIAYNVAPTAEGAAYYYAPEATTAPDFDSATILTENVAASSQQKKELDGSVVIIDAETYEVVNPRVYFGDIAVLDVATQKSFIIRNIGPNRIRFSDFTEVTNAESSIFDYTLVSSSGEAINLNGDFTLNSNDSAIFSMRISPTKLGSKYVDLFWTTTAVSESGAALPGKKKAVSLSGTAEIAKSGAASTNVATLSNSDANISYNQDGSFSIALSKAPLEPVIVCLKVSENATLWTQHGDQRIETDVLRFTASDYNVSQTIYVSLNTDYLRENGTFGDVVEIMPQILSTDLNWSGATFASVILDVDNHIAFIGDNSVDLNQYAEAGTTRWDLNGDGNADVITSGNEEWIDSSDVTSDVIVSYQTKNGVTTQTNFDAAVIALLPSAYGELSTFAQAPGMVSLALSATDVIKRWRIDWGDGSPNTTLSELSSKQVFSHYYAQDGEYEVSVEIVDVNGLGTGVWSNIGKLTVVGVGQSSNAILEVVAEQETLTSELETAASEIAAAFQSTDDNECVAKEDSACMPFIPKSSEERFYGPQDLRKKTKRPLSLF